MGARSNEKKATTRQTWTTDYTGAIKSYGNTPEGQELKEWVPCREPVGKPPSQVRLRPAGDGDTVQKISVYLI